MKTLLKTMFLAGIVTAVLLTPSASAEQFLSDGNLGTGWTHLVPSKTSSGESCMMAYNSQTGLVQFEDVTHYGGSYGSPVSSSGLTVLNTQYGMTGFTHFVPFEIGNAQYFMAYNYSAGQVYINRVNSDCTSSSTLWSHTADPNTRWTHFAPFYLNSAPFIISYNSSSGAVFFDMVNAKGIGTFTVWTGNMGAGWTSMMPFTDVANNPGFLLYNTVTGAVQFNMINSNAQGFVTTYTNTWGKGWTHFVASPVNSKFIAYNATTGLVHFDTMNDDAKGYQIHQTGFWTKGVSLLAPFSFRESIEMGNYAYFGGFVPYTASNGDVQVWLF